MNVLEQKVIDTSVDKTDFASVKQKAQSLQGTTTNPTIEQLQVKHQSAITKWTNANPAIVNTILAASLGTYLMIMVFLIYTLSKNLSATSSATTSSGTPTPSIPCVGTTNIGSYVVSKVCDISTSVDKQGMSSDGQTIVCTRPSDSVIEIYNNCAVKQHHIPISWSADFHIVISGNGQTILYGSSPFNTVPSPGATPIMTQGQITIFDINGTEIEVLTPSSMVSGIGSNFGQRLAISDDGRNIVVCAQDQNNMSHIFIYHKIINYVSSGANFPYPAGSAFGSSLAISGDGSILAVGDQNGGQGGGQAFVLDIYGNQIGSILEPDITSSGTYFGIDISISYNGEIIVISAPGENSNTGSVYIYYNNGNTITNAGKVSPSATMTGFGTKISISGDGKKLVIGAPGENTNKGRVYTYDITGSGTGMVITQGPTADPLNINNMRFGNGVSTSYDGQTILTCDSQCLYIYKQ